jgi:prephenate dehydratase
MKKISVAYQGEPGSFSEQAVRLYFGAKAQAKSMRTFTDAFAYAARHSDAFALLPIENSVYGSIHQVYDLLLKHRLFIVGEVKLRIELNMLALPGVRMNQIRTVYSQAQALGQCETFLNALPHIRIEAFHDTAAAARLIREEGRTDSAAIASANAARVHSLSIVRSNVESNKRNYTRFLVLSQKSHIPVRASKTSFAFAVKDIPGALFKAIAVFTLREINLLKIESRPYPGKPWQYLFYVDVEGSSNRSPLAEAMGHLKEVCTFVKVLGSYKPFGMR